MDHINAQYIIFQMSLLWVLASIYLKLEGVDRKWEDWEGEVWEEQGEHLYFYEQANKNKVCLSNFIKYFEVLYLSGILHASSPLVLISEKLMAEIYGVTETMCLIEFSSYGRPIEANIKITL